MKRNPRASKIIAFHGVLTALILLSVIFPKIGVLSIAVLALISVLVSALFLGFWHGVATGLIFGIFSCIASIASPSSVLSPMFQNPLVSLLPRILIGVTAFLSANGMKKLFPKLKPIFADMVGSLIGVLTNTVLVLGLLLLIYSDGGVVTPVLIGTILLTNSILEIVICTFATPAIVAALKKAIKF